MSSFIPETMPDQRYVLNDPADQQRTFTRDPMHFPFPLSPLFQSVHPVVFPPGYLTAAREMAIPIIDFRFRFLNNYEYESVTSAIPASPEEGRLMSENAEAAMQRELGLMGQRWQDEHLPRVLGIIDQLNEVRTLDPAAPLDAEVLDLLLAWHTEAWIIHFRIALPMLVGIQLLEEFVAEVAGPEIDVHAMLVGVFSESVAAGIGITDLAAQARALGLASLLLETPPGQIDARLREREDAAELVRAIDAYLARYGLTQELLDFTYPTWQEDPTPFYNTMRAYLETGGDNRAAHEEQIRRADAAIDAMRQQLAGYPEQVRETFETLLVLGREGNFLQEEHNFYIDQQVFSSIRLAYLAIGRQLVFHGRLEQADDIFFLYLDEIRALLSGVELDTRGIVAQRHASLEASRFDTPPPLVGAPRTGPPPDNPFMRATSRFFGWMPPTSDDPALLTGYAGSRGAVTAPAFVAATLDAAAGIPAGHVLVTVTTTPAWTPLFGIAAAIVTETGGPLSHCAIVAREYGLPAVVGLPGATSRIQTGELIRVDGASGEVSFPVR